MICQDRGSGKLNNASNIHMGLWCWCHQEGTRTHIAGIPPTNESGKHTLQFLLKIKGHLSTTKSAQDLEGLQTFQEEKNEIRSVCPKPSEHGHRADKDFDELEHLAMQVFSPCEQQSVFKELSCCTKQTETLRDVFGLSSLDELKTEELM
jgi:hypothetical protein